MLRKRHPNQNADLLLKGIALTVFVSLLLAATVSAEDVDGKTVFEKRCTGCQALDADHEGGVPEVWLGDAQAVYRPSDVLFEQD